jgi:hypothetical protein
MWHQYALLWNVVSYALDVSHSDPRRNELSATNDTIARAASLI